MLTLLHPFAALTVITGVLSWLLPEGSLRRTALLSASLLTAVCLLECAQAFFSLPHGTDTPSTVFTETSVQPDDLSAAIAVYTRQAEAANAQDGTR